MKKPNKKNQKGFTLVELLVVIAIIGILAIVAVPALFKNIEKSKVAELEADISAIRSASLSYYADQSEYPINKVDAGETIVELKKDYGSDEPSESTKPATKKILNELEALGFPFGGSYKLTAADGINVAKSPDTLFLTMTASKDSSLSDNGIDKLAKDLGLENPDPAIKTGELGKISVSVSTDSVQIIIIPLIKN